ncbi:hypothetical protein KR222_011609 [Zaprionus bogoriensis]|nr:hypothetical protein KR222_011609 [Zaprionus bogoriensis]
MEDLQFGVCPYNASHRIVLFRMPAHILKCARNYRGPPLAICAYNATHRVLPEQMEAHLEQCLDYYRFYENRNLQIALQGRRSPPKS